MLFCLFSFIVVIVVVCLKKCFWVKKTLMTNDEAIEKNVILCHVYILHNP